VEYKLHTIHMHFHLLSHLHAHTEQLQQPNTFFYVYMLVAWGLLLAWLTVRLLPLRMNVAKTQLMVLSRRGMRDEADSVQVKVGDDELRKQDCVKYWQRSNLESPSHWEDAQTVHGQVGSNKKSWFIHALSHREVVIPGIYTPSSGLLLGGLEWLWSYFE